MQTNNTVILNEVDEVKNLERFDDLMTGRQSDGTRR